MPDNLPVRESTLPAPANDLRSKIGDTKLILPREGLVDLKRADLSGDFELKTDRYKVIKDDDWIVSRVIGHVFSCLSKIYFMDKNMGVGLDAEEVRAVLGMLEKNKELNGTTVRINHNAVFQDCARLFTDPAVKERNNLAARILVGLPTTFFGELFAELSRGDYYNPMTQTAVLYSNVRAVAAHELGHHQDFMRFSEDWWYTMARSIPPVMLYQEWQASKNASNDILAPGDQWQFQRYLLPAFFTYLLASYAISKKLLTKRLKERRSYADPNSINPAQVVRHGGTSNGSFFAGLGAFNVAISAGLHPVIAAAAFLGTWAACKVTADAVLRHVVPYEHEYRPLPRSHEPFATRPLRSSEREVMRKCEARRTGPRRYSAREAL